MLRGECCRNVSGLTAKPDRGAVLGRSRCRLQHGYKSREATSKTYRNVVTCGSSESDTLIPTLFETEKEQSRIYRRTVSPIHVTIIKDDLRCMDLRRLYRSACSIPYLKCSHTFSIALYHIAADSSSCWRRDRATDQVPSKCQIKVDNVAPCFPGIHT